MKIHTVLLVLMLAGLAACTPDTPEAIVQGISRGPNAMVRIAWNGRIIYVDPIGVPDKDPASLVLVTHSHSDHFAPGAVRRLTGSDTKILAPFADTALGANKIVAGESTEWQGIKVEAVPAYNIRKTGYHPREHGYLGYVLTLGSVRVYIAGDTERIPEMKNLKVDIAVMPLGQTYTMDSVDEAVEAVLDTGASIGIPNHFSSVEGNDADAAAFVEKLSAKGCKGIIVPKKT